MCTVDPTFRRTAKRRCVHLSPAMNSVDLIFRKLQELEQELEKIKATEKRSDIAQSPTLLPTISQSTPSNPSPSMAVSDTRRNPIQSRQIGDICVPARTLDEILQQLVLPRSRMLELTHQQLLYDLSFFIPSRC